MVHPHLAESRFAESRFAKSRFAESHTAEIVIIDSIVPLPQYIALIFRARFVGKCIAIVRLIASAEREPIMGV